MQTSAYRIMIRSLGVAALLSAVSFLFMLAVAGASLQGIIFALAMALFTFGMSVWAAVTVCLE